MKPTTTLVCLVLMLLISACVPLPVPHHSVNAPRFSGQVVSATTHRPVAGASVALRGLEDTTVQTDAAGHYATRVSRTTHLAGLYTYDDGMRVQIPPARRSDGVLLVSHPGYQTTETPADCSPYPQPFVSDDNVETRKLPDIRLRPATR